MTLDPSAAGKVKPISWPRASQTGAEVARTPPSRRKRRFHWSLESDAEDVAAKPSPVTMLGRYWLVARSPQTGSPISTSFRETRAAAGRSRVSIFKKRRPVARSRIPLVGVKILPFQPTPSSARRGTAEKAASVVTSQPSLVMATAVVIRSGANKRSVATRASRRKTDTVGEARPTPSAGGSPK